MDIIGCQVNHGHDCEEFVWLDDIPSDWVELEGNTYQYYSDVIPEEYEETLANHVCWLMGLPDRFPNCPNEIGDPEMNWFLEFWQR